MVFEQKNQLYKKLPSCSIIRDIVDGIEYKKFKQNGGFLTNEDHLTLLFNTDGIPLYKSSKVNIGPVFLAINELPLEVQFAKKYNSLGTLARGRECQDLQHSSKCLLMTVYTTNQGKGHVQCYPFQDPPVTLRTSDSILENALSAVKNDTRVKGFYDVTPLVKFLWFDLVLGIVLDYMHGVLLRVTKQFLDLWLPP